MVSKSRTPSELMLLLLLPAPITGVVLMLVAVYSIASGTGQQSPASVVADTAPTATLSAEAMLIATVSAAPVREAPIVVSAEMEVALAAYDPAMVEQGHTDYLAVCSACHGTDAKGISGLGKPLLGSEFVRGLDDAGLLEFIITGRNIWDPGNTTGVQMPARGGNPGLTDASIMNIIAYIRTQDGFAVGGEGAATVAPSDMPVEDGAAAVESTPAEDIDTSFTPIDTSGLAGLGTSTGNTEPAEANVEPVAEGRTGEALYNALCNSNAPVCDYLTTQLATGTSESDLTTQLLNGLSSFAAGNTSGINIPAGGGLFPAMTEAEVTSLLAYLKGLSGESAEPESAPSEVVVETPSQERTSETLSTAVCGSNVALCDYLTAQLAAGVADSELAAQLLNGYSMFAAGNTSGVNVPQGGGIYPPLTEAEINNLLATLKATP